MNELYDWVPRGRKAEDAISLSSLIYSMEQAGLTYPKRGVDQTFTPTQLCLSKFWGGFKIYGDVLYNGKVARISYFPPIDCKDITLIRVLSEEMGKEDVKGLMEKIKQVILSN